MSAARDGRVDERDSMRLRRRCVSWSASAAPTLLICNQMVSWGQSSSSGSTTSRTIVGGGEHRDHDPGVAHHLGGAVWPPRRPALESTQCVRSRRSQAMTAMPWSSSRRAIAEPIRPTPSSPTRAVRLVVCASSSSAPFDFGDVVVGEVEGRAGQDRVDLVGAAEADDRAVDGRVAQRPGDGDRARGGVVPVGDRIAGASTSSRLRESCGSLKRGSCLRQSSSGRRSTRSRVMPPVSMPEPIGE